MLRKLIPTKKQQGFTIIEVLIVLAIAGLILVVVLLAIPQLQRNQRNEARRSAASRIVTEINNFGGNNNGNYPVADSSATAPTGAIGNPNLANTFFGRYLGCSGSPADCTANIDDPQTGFPLGTGVDGTTGSADTVAAAAGTLGADAGDVYYSTGAICSGETPTVTGASARNFVFIVRLEGGAGYCLDNR